MTSIQKKRLSIAHLGQAAWNKGKQMPKGEKSAHWKGGKSKCLDCLKIVSSVYSKRCRPCQNKFKVGDKHHSFKGGFYSCLDCGNKTKGYSVRHCKSCSLEYMSGPKHYNWKGGITPVNEKVRKSHGYRLWREAVYKRDNFTCQDCKIRGGELHAHHIKPFSLFPELRLAIDNGVTLCKLCHMKTETWGGKILSTSIAQDVNL